MPEDRKLLELILAEAPTEAEILELPGWRKDSTIKVKARRPSFYALLAENAVLNPLIPEMNKLFVGHDRGDVTKDAKEYAAALVAIARLTLAEPTYDELIEAGVTLTDDQLTDISLYATEGMDFLLSFRTRTRDRAGQHDQPVSGSPQPNAGDTESAAGLDTGRGHSAFHAAAEKWRQAEAKEDGEQRGHAEEHGR